MAGTNAAAVFIIVPVDDVVAAFHTPVAAVISKHLLGIGLLPRRAGDAVDSLPALYTTFLVDGLAFDHECLTYMRKVQVVVQCGSGPDFSGFDTPVFTLAGLNEIGRYMLVFKIVGGLFEQFGLITLGGEMVVCPAFDQVIGQFTLSEQRVGGDGSSGNVDGIKQGGGRFYLIGLFFLIAALGAQCADFFCV